MSDRLTAMLARLLLFLALLALGPAAVAQTPPAAATSSPEPAAASSVQPAAETVPLEQIRAFTRVYAAIKHAYVDEIDDRALMQAAIDGMLHGFDPHSAWLDLDGLQQLRENTSGEYAGIGVRVAVVEDQLRVISPLDGTPAARAGMQAGDVILGIDGHAVTSGNVRTSLDALRGPAGSTVKLSVLHQGASQPETVALVRERIRIRSVHGRELEPGYGYIRIAEFQQPTATAVRKRLGELASDQALRGLVLDLRNNPGGLLASAVAVSDLFLTDGLIVSTRGRAPGSDLEFHATGGDVLDTAPIVVLVNQGTASAAEIVAGALKDQHRALVVGQRSFGKGSVQTVLPINTHHAIKLTTARYYTPSGNSIQAAGVTPDIVLADLAAAPRLSAPSLVITEADLPHHLDGGMRPRVAAADEALAVDDYALAQALHVLKGLALARRQPAVLR